MYMMICAHLSAFTSALIGSIEFYFTGWEELNLFQKIIKVLFIWMVLVQIINTIVVFILALVGKIVCIFPIVNFVYAIVVYLVYMVGVAFGLIGSLYSPARYIKCINDSYRRGLEEARQYV